MSAYALPGLFPPIEMPSSLSSNSVSRTEDAASNRPQHELEEQKQQQRNESSRIAEIFQASVGRFYPGSVSRDTAASSSVSERHAEQQNKRLTYSASDEYLACRNAEDALGIAVKEAKIDPVRLVQCFTGSSSKRQGMSQSRKTLRRRNSPENLTSSPKSSGGQKRSSQSDNNNNNCEDAIEFELSITFNGRKYTATRTLQCIVQLRDDLIREMKNRKRWLQTRGGTLSLDSSSRPHQAISDPRKTEDGEYDDEAIQIPEIPPITGEESGCSSGGFGFVGRGFSMLHAMATSYVPVMEGWLRSVLAIVPQDSECLSNFLWEPLDSSNAAVELLDLKSSFASLAGLGSIKELDYNTEDDDEDSEFDNEW